MDDEKQDKQVSWAHTYFLFMFLIMTTNLTIYLCAVGLSSYYGYDTDWVANVPGMKEVLFIPKHIGNLI